MTSTETTRPINVEGNKVPSLGPWQPDHQAWSFGSSRKRLIAALAPTPKVLANDGSANGNGAATTGAQDLKVPDTRPRPIPVTSFGKRGLTPLYQWEGVVEQVYETGFRARLVPLQRDGVSDARPEFTDFDFEDLSDPSDRELLTEGAVFYWTLGRAKNEAGTIANTSLVRFRRVPAPGPYQLQRAEAEANQLIEAFRTET